MITINHFIASLFFSLIPLSNDYVVNEGSLQLVVENIQKPKGKMIAAIYKDEDNFLKDGKAVVTKEVLVEKINNLTIDLPNLPFGEYSVAVYHDVNGNQKLDTNLLGIPTEPYGFSNNARSKWGAPKYDVAKFYLNESTKKMVIQVKKWSKQ